MIEVVRLSDLQALIALHRDLHKDQSRAIRLILEIVRCRMPQPRAYLAEPANIPEDRRAIWEIGYDLLGAQLRDAGKSIIDADTLRMLLVFCPVMHESALQPDPLWRAFLSDDLVDELWLPGKDTNNKRHARMQRYAAGTKTRVYRWHAESIPVRIPRRVGHTAKTA